MSSQKRFKVMTQVAHDNREKLKEIILAGRDDGLLSSQLADNILLEFRIARRKKK